MMPRCQDAKQDFFLLRSALLCLLVVLDVLDEWGRGTRRTIVAEVEECDILS